ncbi:thioredoxin domain-containing protein [Nocardiopsis sp. HNM0947]|uniref:Thioredoxin domain-containing protein n=1 Tax=Nocardiopsis coralli TaxID=2772213 RepID=A0ABR9P0F5_9ACTN|nr:thioredoxin domain-containing protein [Nocardiopsis coralli]MBE2997300.1 thioredoxin domain-containing protein [Nocardiopsis coralli]
MGSEARKRARERIKEQREKEKKAAQRNKTLLVVGAAAAVVLLVVGIGYVVLSSDRGDDYEGELAQQTLQDDGSVVMGDGSVVTGDEGAEAPVVEVYADYQCPACKQFEGLNGDTLKEMAAEGEATVQYHIVSIFAQQPAPTSSNSLRAAVAGRASADHGVFVEYNDVLFENQPNSNEEGYSIDELEGWFGDLGVTDEQQAAFGERLEQEDAVITEFTEEFVPALMSAAEEEIGQENLGTMVLPDLLAWGEDNGHDTSFLDGTYTGEIIDATGTAYTRYSGENAFRGTPSVYVNGELLDNDDAMTVRGLTDTVEAAGPGQVESEPADDTDDGGGAE